MADPTTPPAQPGFSLKTYRTLTGLIRPAAPLFLKTRAMRGKEDLARRGERMGRAALPRPDGRLAWVHAASVGETNAVLPLLQALRARQPDIRFLLTTGTITSAEIAARRLDPLDIHQYVPLDVPDFASRFLDHWQPDLAIFTESEIWPNLLIETARRGIPLSLVNARMSKRSFSRWRRSPASSQPLFNRFNLVLAQNAMLARRFGELGARSVQSVGNLKIDAPAPPVDASELQRMTHALSGRPHFVAASTHDGEDEIVGNAHKLLANAQQNFCTIVVPRHPERGGAVVELMRKLGLSVAQRSHGALPEPGIDIYVADTLGELGTFYAMSPVAFIGGSLVPHGGQNPIEALRHSAAVITGPHWSNFSDAYRALLKNRAALQVKTAEDLAHAAQSLLGDQVELARMRASAQVVLDDLSGALQRTVDALLPLLPDSEGLRRAS